MENNAAYNPDSKNGWIAAQRATRFHPIVGMGKPVAPADARRGSFSRYEAWQDLEMMACHAPSEWINKGRKVMLGVGQLGGAYSFLADRWNWTIKQVRGFLERLIGDALAKKETPADVKNDDQLHSLTSSEPLPKKGKQSNNLVQTITICNYRTYQVASEIAEIQKGQAKGKRRASEGHDSSNKETREQDRSPTGDSSPAVQGDLLNGADEARKGMTSAEAAKRAVAAWNLMAKPAGLPTVKAINDDRRKKLPARIREAGGLTAWIAVINKIPKCPVLMENPTWSPNIDFVCQASSFLKLMEGAYDAKPAAKGFNGHASFEERRRETATDWLLSRPLPEKRPEPAEERAA